MSSRGFALCLLSVMSYHVHVVQAWLGLLKHVQPCHDADIEHLLFCLGSADMTGCWPMHFMARARKMVEDQAKMRTLLTPHRTQLKRCDVTFLLYSKGQESRSIDGITQYEAMCWC